MNYSKSDFQNKSRYFLLFDNLEIIALELYRLIESNKYKCEIAENQLIITFILDIVNIDNFILNIPKKEEIELPR